MFSAAPPTGPEVGGPPPPGVPPANAPPPGGYVIMAAPPRKKLPTPMIVVLLIGTMVILYIQGRHAIKSNPPASDATPVQTARIKTDPLKLTPKPTPFSVDPLDPQRSLYLASEQRRLAEQAAMNPNGQAAYQQGLYPGQQVAQQQQQSVSPAQLAAEERRHQEEESLSASSVIPIPDGSETASAAQAPYPALNQTQSRERSTEDNEEMPAKAKAKPADVRADCVDTQRDGQQNFALCEGTYLSAVVDNRIVADFAGPVKAYVLLDVLSKDGQHVLIPRGTTVLGDADAVGGVHQDRVSVSFHRMILPNGEGYLLDKLVGLDQAGETALKGKANHHYLSTLSTAAVIGALAGFSQFGSGSAFTGGGFDSYRQGVAQNLSFEGQILLQRNLNRMPTLTIPEGKIIALYINTDLHIPEYKAKR